MSNINFDTRFIADISGNFYLPDYQRGYRWTRDEIKLLLDDIYENGDKPYCLQPIVVKKMGDKYELIDGQQRLTTLYLIYKYLEKTLNNDLYAPPFSLEYQTRKQSAKFLKDLDLEHRDDNIDFFFMANAYECIRDYFEKDEHGNPKRPKPGTLTRLNQYLESNVSVLWYEVDSDQNGIELFERLNIGKIPLTSSELVKALFLRDSAAGELSGRQEEISLQWDAMEHDLRESSFWGFLTNSKPDEYPTRIDLLLDLIADKGARCRDKYHTFFYFDRIIKDLRQSQGNDVLMTVWSGIHHVYLTLREWYSNHDFYHKIGYLITSRYRTVGEIYKLWKGSGENPLSKDVFTAELDRLIRESIALSGRDELEELSYGTNQAPLHNVLLLFNVETERLMDEGRRRFPFDKHKEGHWSLEHIHARHSEGLETNDKILTWLRDHVKLLHSGAFGECSVLADSMDELIYELENNKNVVNVRQRFQKIQSAATDVFTIGDRRDSEENYRDNIANMALIDGGQNAALSNYVFDAKRSIIIDYDKNGRYIPICTKMVFFKYYSPVDASLHFWGEADRRAYMDAMDKIISPYYTMDVKDNECELTD